MGQSANRLLRGVTSWILMQMADPLVVVRWSRGARAGVCVNLLPLRFLRGLRFRLR